MKKSVFLGIVSILISCGVNAENLQDVLIYSYENNLALSAERAGQRATDEEVAKAKSGYRPTVVAEGSVGRAYNKLDYVNPLMSDGEKFHQNPMSAQVSFVQPIFSGFSIASSIGFDFGEAQGTDAITPLLYPDLMEDNAFVTRLFDIQVETLDGRVKTTYYDYLRHHQKVPWWNGFTSWLSGLLKKKPTKNGADEGKSPYQLSMSDDDLVDGIRERITLSIDKKTGVVSINVKDQDPKVCKILADTMQVYLQEFITEYRTKKAHVDVQHYEQLCAESLKEYNDARLAYAKKADANRNAVLQRVALEISDLESNMQLKYNTYTAYNAQLQTAYAKLQERTPAFTIIKGAAVPVRPAGPKRLMFILGMLVLTSLCVTMYLLKDTLWKF